jgi:hypothetical protein
MPSQQQQQIIDLSAKVTAAARNAPLQAAGLRDQPRMIK